MSRTPKDKPAEEVSVPTAVASRRKGRTKLRPVDRPRYVMSLSEASNPYKGQSGGNGTIGYLDDQPSKEGPLSFRPAALRSNMNRIKIDISTLVPSERRRMKAYMFDDGDVNGYYYMILGDDALIDVTYSNKLLFRDSF